MYIARLVRVARVSCIGVRVHVCICVGPRVCRTQGRFLTLLYNSLRAMLAALSGADEGDPGELVSCQLPWAPRKTFRGSSAPSPPRDGSVPSSVGFGARLSVYSERETRQPLSIMERSVVACHSPTNHREDSSTVRGRGLAAAAPM